MKTNLGTSANLLQRQRISSVLPCQILTPQCQIAAEALDFNAVASDLDAVVLEDLIYTLLVHRTQSAGRYLEGDRPIQLRDKDLFGHEVRALDASGLALRVGDVVAHHAALTRYLTNSSHFSVLR
jgi:hypothetical protein